MDLGPTFVASGLLSGLGTALSNQIAQQGVMERDAARMQLEHQNRLSENQQASDLAARNQGQIEAQRAQDEQTLEQQREGSAQQIAQKRIDAEAPLRQAQTDEARGRANYFNAFAKATASGARWNRTGISGGTEFERLTARLATLPPEDEDLRPIITNRIQKLAGGMSSGQVTDMARKAALADAQLNRDNFSGDPDGLAGYQQQRFQYWKQIYTPSTSPRSTPSAASASGGVAPSAPAPSMPAAPRTSVQPSPAPPPTAPRQGTQANPWRPTTNADFARIRSGEVYVNPADGRLYKKN